MKSNRRRKFLINRPLQFRYMAYITITLAIVSAIVIANLYFGIWGNILSAFSDEQIRNDLLTASRVVEYEKARLSSQGAVDQPLSFFREAERLSQHQQEVFKDILADTNKQLMPKFLLLLVLITWASIYLTHKIAGPLYRFTQSLRELSDGNLKVRVKLRTGDEGKDVANQFNLAAETLDRSVSRLKNIVKENKSNPDQLISRLEEELDKLKSSVDE